MSQTARCLVTKDAIREARRKEIKAEMFNSAKLKVLAEQFLQFKSFLFYFLLFQQLKTLQIYLKMIF